MLLTESFQQVYHVESILNYLCLEMCRKIILVLDDTFSKLGHTKMSRGHNNSISSFNDTEIN